MADNPVCRLSADLDAVCTTEQKAAMRAEGMPEITAVAEVSRG